jgi:hypothetical protein
LEININIIYYYKSIERRCAKVRVITKPKAEEEILVVISEKTTSKIILEEMINNADLCVNHLCGCVGK